MLLPLLVQNLAPPVPATGIAHFEITDCARDVRQSDVSIQIDGLSYGSSNGIGVFNAMLSAGLHAYLLEKPGFYPATGSFVVPGSATLELLVCLDQIPQPRFYRAEEYAGNPAIPKCGHYA
jgi:hypothetical protein